MVLAVPLFDSARKMFAHVVAHVVQCGPVRVAPGHAVPDESFQFFSIQCAMMFWDVFSDVAAARIAAKNIDITIASLFRN